jgi:superfamily I DNA/RNA helicase
VSANAGSGKTTAISQRLVAMSRDPAAREALQRMAVVTYTNKAADEIALRTRDVLWRQLAEEGSEDFAALEALDGVVFGTIHSFCLHLARQHGAEAGLSLGAELVAGDDEAVWERFITEVPLEFDGVSNEMVAGFLRHARWEQVFALAQQLSAAQCNRLRQRAVPEAAAPDPAGLVLLRSLDLKGAGRANKVRTQERAEAWQERWDTGEGYLPLFAPSGTAAAVVEAVEVWMAPLRRWLGDVGGLLAAELAERFRAWRREKGLQTYADQVEGAVAVLEDGRRLDVVRAEGWRVLLDEAQDTDPEQFRILVEITRPVGVGSGSWPTEPVSGVGGGGSAAGALLHGGRWPAGDLRGSGRHGQFPTPCAGVSAGRRGGAVGVSSDFPGAPHGD